MSVYISYKCGPLENYPPLSREILWGYRFDWYISHSVKQIIQINFSYIIMLFWIRTIGLIQCLQQSVGGSPLDFNTYKIRFFNFLYSENSTRPTVNLKGKKNLILIRIKVSRGYIGPGLQFLSLYKLFYLHYLCCTELIYTHWESGLLPTYCFCPFWYYCVFTFTI